MSVEAAIKLLDKALFLVMTKPPSDELGNTEFSPAEKGVLEALLVDAKEELLSVKC